MPGRPFLLHSRNVRPVTSSGRTVAVYFPSVITKHLHALKTIQSSEFISLKDIVMIAIFMKVFPHFVTTPLLFLLCIINGPVCTG